VRSSSRFDSKGYLEKERYYIEERNLKGEVLKSYRLSVVVQKDADGYHAFCPELQGCYTQGDSYEGAVENARDAIRLHLQDRIENGEEIPSSERTALAFLEVTI
jgi:predicted RNase H-like HicB family nuclease